MRRPIDKRKLKSSTTPGALRLGLVLFGAALVALIYAAITHGPKVVVTDLRDPNRVVSKAADDEPVSFRPLSNGLLFSGNSDREEDDQNPEEPEYEGGEWYAEETSRTVNGFVGLGEGRDALEARLDAFGDVVLTKHTASPTLVFDGEMRPALTPELKLFDPLVVDEAMAPTLFGLQGIDTGKYHVYSQQNKRTTADIAFRLEAMNERYHALFEDVCNETNVTGKVFVFTDRNAMTAAGGHPFMPGAFLYTNDEVGPRLLIRSSGQADIPFWELLNHEGWHQFCALHITPGMPLWLDEGMAMYLGYGILTGDGTVEGTMRPAVYYSLLESAPQFEKLEDFMKITNVEWHERASNGTVWPSYMQAWSLVHFLRRADGGRYSDILDDYIADVSAGRDARSSQRRIIALEGRYSRWLKSLTFSDEHAKYFEAITGILTSYLARAHAQGQRFRDADEFVDAFRRDRLKLPEQGQADWLPPSIRTDGMWYLDQMEAAYGPCEIEIVNRSGKPSIRLRHDAAGIDLQGSFTLDDDAVESVTVKWLSKEPDNLEDAYVGR